MIESTSLSLCQFFRMDLIFHGRFNGLMRGGARTPRVFAEEKVWSWSSTSTVIEGINQQIDTKVENQGKRYPATSDRDQIFSYQNSQ